MATKHIDTRVNGGTPPRRGQLLKAGQLSQAEIARQLGVSRAAVSQWAQTVRQAGTRGLKPRRAPGSRSKLTCEQQCRLKHMVKQGAQASGFQTERWTLARVKQVIQREFHVNYCRNTELNVKEYSHGNAKQHLCNATPEDTAQMRQQLW